MTSQKNKKQLELELKQAQKKIADLEKEAILSQNMGMQENDDDFHDFIEQSHNGIVMFDEQGSVCIWNPAQEQITGIPKERAIGSPYWEVQSYLLTPESRSPSRLERMKATMQNAFKTGHQHGFDQALEIEIQPPLGERKTISLSSFSIKTATGYRIGSIVHDITEQRNNEKALRDSEQSFSSVFHSSPSPQLIVVLNTGQIMDVNEAFCLQSGYQREDLIGHTTVEFNLWVHPHEMNDMLGHLQSNGKLHNLEVDVRTSSGEIRTLLLSFEPITLKGAKCIISTGMDITERKRASKALEESENNFRAFFNTIDHLLFVLDMEGNILLVNDSVTRKLGYSINELKGKSVLMVHPPERREEAGRIVREMLSGMADYCPVPLLTKDGKQIPVETRVVPGRWSGQDVIFGVTKDLTDIKASEEKFSKAFRSSPALMAITDIDTGKYLDVNEMFLQTLGYTRDEVIEKNTLELSLFHDSNQRALLLDRMKIQGYLRNEEVLVHGKSGELHYGIFAAEYLHLQNRTVLLTVMNDITEYRQTEAKLRESEDRYRNLVENLNEVVMEVDGQGNYCYLSPNYDNLFGYSHKEELGKSVLAHAHPDDIPMLLRSLQKMEGPTLPDMIYRVKTKSGEWRWIETSGKIYHPESGAPRVIGAAHDVTERKNLEDQLQKKQQMLFEAQSIARLQSWTVDLQTGILEIGPGEDHMLGWPLEVYNLDTLMDMVHPADKEHMVSAWANATAERSVNVEYRIMLGEELKWVHLRARVTFDENGRPISAVGITQDITERKQAEELVLAQRNLARLTGSVNSESEAWPLFVESAIQVSGMDCGGIYLLNENDHSFELVHHQGLGRKFMQSVSRYPIDAPLVQNTLAGRSSYINADEIRQMEFIEIENLSSIAIIPLQHKERIIGGINIASHVLTKVSKQSQHALETIAADMGNIIIQLRTEALLRESEEQYKTIIESTMDVIFILDETGRQLFFNGRVEEVLGYKTGETIGRSFTEFVPIKELPKYLRQLKNAFQHKEVTNFVTQIYHKNGHLVDVEINGRIISQNGKHVAQGSIRDITERKQAEKALRESEERFRSLFENSPVGVLLADPQGNILEVNPSALSILGSPSAEATRQINILNFPPLIEAGIATDFQNCIQTAQPFLSEHLYVTKWKKTISLNLRFTPLVDASGKIMFALVLLEDVSERRQAEKALHESEEKYRGLMESLNSVVATVNYDGIVLYMNDTAAQQLGSTPKKLIGKTMHELFPKDHADRQLGRVQKVIREDQPAVFDTQTFIQGKLRWNHTSIQPIHDGSGQVVHALINTTDVDEIKETQQKLEDLNHTLEERVKQRTAEVQDMYENAPIGYHSLDVNSNLIMINQTHLNWLSYSREEMIGRSILDFLTPQSKLVFQEAYPDFMHRGWVRDLELDLLRKDGSVLPTLISSTAIYNERGDYLMSRSTVFDNTQRKLANETLQQANLELERAMRMKDEFFASMSHELRTPLNGVLGFSEALQAEVYGELNERQMTALANIDSSGRHLLELISDILDVSKSQAGKLELELGKCSLGDICQSSIQITNGIAMKKQQVVYFTMSPANIELQGDVRRLKQILVNLLSNAVKFTPIGGELGLDVTASELENTVSISFWDKGIGIPSEDLKKLFHPFVQLDSSLSRQQGGTGLGLALVQQLVDLHGGHIQVESTPGKGSRFTVVLPCYPIGSTQPSIENFHPMKFQVAQIIADNSINSDYVTHALDTLGIKSFTTNEEDASENIHSPQPDIIFLDSSLSQGSARELLEQLKSNKNTQNIPIIVVSEHAGGQPNETLQVDGYLFRLFKVSDLSNLLERLHGSIKSSKLPESPTATIMIVDDDELNITALSEYLRAQHYNVVNSSGGVDFLSRVEQVRPDIVLMDIQMPEMDGLETTRRLRGLPDQYLASLPVIAVTALAMPGDRERCINMGVDEYISKPISLQKTKELIQKVLENKIEKEC